MNRQAEIDHSPPFIRRETESTRKTGKWGSKLHEN